MPEPGDQTEAELEKTRRVVAEHMAQQIATNAGVLEDVADDVGADEPAGSLDDMTKAELLELATEAEIEGRYAMNKAELVEALEGTTR